MYARLATTGIVAALLALPAVAPTVQAGETRHESPGSNWLVTTDDEPHFAYILVRKKISRSESSGKTRTGYHTTGSGEGDDFRKARDVRERMGRDILWVRLDQKEYVILDRGVMEELEETLLPQEMLGRQQGLLGKQQGRLGDRQARLGQQQAELGERQGRLGERQARLSAEIARRSAGGLSTEGLEREMKAVSREQSDLGDRQQALGQAQSQLGREQNQLGHQQSELGAQQSELARVIDRKLERLIERAVSSGLAQPIG